MNIQHDIYFDSLNRSFVLYYNSSKKVIMKFESFDKSTSIHINNPATSDTAILIKYHGLYHEHGKRVDEERIHFGVTEW